MLVRVLGVALATLVSTSALAGNVTNFKYKPADFAFEGQDILNRLDVSSLEGKNISAAFYCRADISAMGKAFEADCYNGEKLGNLESQVETALSTLSFSPALIDEKAVAVRFSFRVVLNQNSESASVQVIPNLGSLQQQYGLSYVEPQERLDTVEWFERYSRADTQGSRFLGGEKMVRVAANVEVDGVASDIGTLEIDRQSRELAKEIGQSLKSSKFIPGFVENEPVAMPYLAIVSYQ